MESGATTVGFIIVGTILFIGANLQMSAEGTAIAWEGVWLAGGILLLACIAFFFMVSR